MHVSRTEAHYIVQVEMATLYLRMALGAFVAISQIDIVILACVSSCVTAYYTTQTFLDNKTRCEYESV